jgi:site-specific recombinase XerD
VASIFKKARDRQRKGASWYIAYVDENGRRRMVKGCPDKAATEAMARKLESEAGLRRRGVIDPKADAYANHEARPLADHLADWHRDMQARARTIRHADQYVDRASRLAALIEGASPSDLWAGRTPAAQERTAAVLSQALRKARLSDLTAERIQSALAMLRDMGKALQTVNHFRAALRAFCLWAKKTGRLRDNPMEGVAGYNVEEDIRHVRRILTPDELSRLIQAAESGPVLNGMPGTLRAMAYRTAAATGFRVEELRSLTAESFRLTGPAPSIYLQAAATKNRKPADQPIPLALADALRAWLRRQPAGESVFPLHHDTAKAIRGDLATASIPYETEDGVADFHSLRGFYISALVRSGASIAEVRKLARHAKPETTLKHYAKVAAHDLRRAVEALPTPSPAPPTTEAAALSATGTDGRILAAHGQRAGDGTGRKPSDAGGSPVSDSASAQNDHTPETPGNEGFGRVLSASDGFKTERGGFESCLGTTLYRALSYDITPERVRCCVFTTSHPATHRFTGLHPDPAPSVHKLSTSF